MNRKPIRVLATFVGLLLTAGGFGQPDEITFGAHAGLSIPNIRGGEDNPFTRGFISRQGPFFGIFMKKALAPHLSLVAEINDTSQGGLRKGLQPITMDLPQGLPVPPGTLLYANFRNENILDYLEIPVMGRLTFGARTRFFINAGPYVGILLRARALTRGSSAIYLDENGTMPISIPPDTEPLVVDLGADTNVRDSLRSTNIGLAGGGGFIYPLGPGSLFFEGRFQLGLTTIQKNVETDGNTQTGAIVISLGYALSLSGKK